MTKKYKFERKFNLILSICTAVFYIGLIAFFATRPEFAVLNESGSYLGIMVLILVTLVLGCVSFFPVIVAVTGFLELKDGVLSRTYFGVKIWSVQVLQITDIYRGNTGGRNYSSGLTFRTQVGEKNYWKQAPYTILDERDLTSDLTAINANINFHDDPQDLQRFWGKTLF